MKKRVVKRVVPYVPPPGGLYPHKLKVKCRTRIGWHKPGEIGCFISNADGTGSFFPDRGGMVKLRASSVVPVRVTEAKTREQARGNAEAIYKGKRTVKRVVTTKRRAVKRVKVRRVKRIRVTKKYGHRIPTPSTL